MTSLAYRPAIDADLGLVFGAWKSSFRSTFLAMFEPPLGRCPFPVDRYDEVMRETITRIVGRPDARVIVAYHPGELERKADLYGFLCYELAVTCAPMVHYCFVKKNYREHGIARGMFRAAGIDAGGLFTFTHRTPAVKSLGQKIGRACWVGINLGKESDSEQGPATEAP